MLPVVPMLPPFQRELNLFCSWYNQERPHSTLEGATPDEIYFARRPRAVPHASSPGRLASRLALLNRRRSSRASPAST